MPSKNGGFVLYDSNEHSVFMCLGACNNNHPKRLLLLCVNRPESYIVSGIQDKC